MKVLLRLLFISILAASAGCAANSQKDELYQAYVDCQNEHKVPKVDSRGIVALDSESNPIMTYSKDVCTAENAAYNVAAEKAEKAYDRRQRMPGCVDGSVLYCNGQCTPRDLQAERCQCSCISHGRLNDMLRGYGHRY
jgi:hypothetical protein